MLKYWLPRQICMTFTCNHFFYFTRALDCIASRQWLNFLSRKDSITKSLLNYEKWCTSQKRIWNFPSSSSLSGLLMWKITNWRKEPLWSTFPTQMQLSRGRNLAKFCSRENPQFWKVTRQVFLDLFEVACKRDTSYFRLFQKNFHLCIIYILCENAASEYREPPLVSICRDVSLAISSLFWSFWWYFG